jgi:phenylpropionate dioxygenase-like ring-hydroxylating dioxygenase large terminal subunit
VTLALRAARRTWTGVSRPPARFANPHVVCEGWYAVGSARAIGRGRVRRAWIGPRDIVLYRGLDGTLHAVDRACAHLGADLAHGTVVERGLQCAFHRWCWGADGSCTAGGGVATGARLAAYHVRERWGLVWVWAGRTPAYELPRPQAANERHVLRLPAQRIACHPHVVLGNGLDLTHVVPVHRFRFEGEPAIESTEPYRLSIDVRARFAPTWMRRLLRMADRPARWRFTTIGPSLAWVQVASPEPFELLWTARPLRGGGCATQTVFFLPRLSTFARALPMMVATTWADRRVLDGLEFRPGLVASDAVFAQYVQLVEELDEWTVEPPVKADLRANGP